MDTRTHIMTAATAVFAEKGFAQTSMNDIVNATGLSKGGIYWHFKSKDDIISAIFQQYFEAQYHILESILVGEGTASEKFIGLVQSAGAGMEAFADQFPASLEFYALAAKNEMLRQQLESFFLSYREHIEQLTREAIANGEWAAYSVTEIANTIVSILEGVLLIWNFVPDQIDLSAQLDTAVTLLLNGLQNSADGP